MLIGITAFLPSIKNMPISSMSSRRNPYDHSDNFKLEIRVSEDMQPHHMLLQHVHNIDSNRINVLGENTPNAPELELRSCVKVLSSLTSGSFPFKPPSNASHDFSLHQSPLLPSQDNENPLKCCGIRRAKAVSVGKIFRR